MSNCRWAFIPLIVWAAFAQEIRREGPFWVQTLTGSEPVAARGRLDIRVPGSVTLRGGDVAVVSYTCRLRVRASDANEAEQLLRRSGLQKGRHGETTFLIIGGNANGSTELQITAPRNLAEVSLVTHGGNLDASNLRGSVRAEAGGGRIRIDRVDGDVTIRSAGGMTSLGMIGGMVQCLVGGGNIIAESIGGGAVFESGGGEILVKNVQGPLRATTVGGGIHIMRAGGAVTVSTGGGPLQVDHASGMVVARNSGGPIQVGYAPGVRCESASGTIRVNNVSGSMHASTAVGDVTAAYLRDRPAVDSFLSTGSGDITVVIPSNLSVTVRAENAGSGSAKTIISEFPGVVVRSQGGAVTAQGPINGGGPLLRLSGNGGMIFIKKEK
ncbi:MAG: DUF4097 domain-containing protein [Acidobacteriota bacterium]|nr:DUF4097 domain-containing protein [Acidobacteriota bacterium]